MIYNLFGKDYEAKKFYHFWKKSDINSVSDDVFERVTFGFALGIEGRTEMVREIEVTWEKSFRFEDRAGHSTIEIAPSHLDVIPYVSDFLATYSTEERQEMVYPDRLEELLKLHGFEENVAYDA